MLQFQGDQRDAVMAFLVDNGVHITLHIPLIAVLFSPERLRGPLARAPAMTQRPSCPPTSQGLPRRARSRSTAMAKCMKRFTSHVGGLLQTGNSTQSRREPTGPTPRGSRAVMLLLCALRVCRLVSTARASRVSFVSEQESSLVA